MSIGLKSNNEESSKKCISLEEKIQILEKFSQTGEELVGNTIFEGYPIGRWVIQMRSILNRINEGKDEKRIIKPTKEQLERLENLGILERQIDSNIDEKIDSLIEWRRKYPKAQIKPIVSKDVLREYAKTEEDIKQLEKEYKKIRKYYDYIRIRKSEGLLDEERIEKCKEGNVGGVFKNSTKIEFENNELIEKYGLDEKFINSIRRKFGSIEEFRKIYINALINETVDRDIPKEILNTENLIIGIDLNSPDLVLRKRESEKFLYDILSNESTLKEIPFITSEGLEEKLFEQVKKVEPIEKNQQILFKLYGINNEEQLNIYDIANEFNISEKRVRQILASSLRNLYVSSSERFGKVYDIDYDLKKEFFEEYFKNFDIFVSKEPTIIEKDIKIKLKNMVLEANKKTKKRKEQVDIIKILSPKQKRNILKVRFGEKISSSNFSVLPPWNNAYKKYDGKDINEDLEIPSLDCDIFKECVDSKFIQYKIIEFLIDNFPDVKLTEDKKNLNNAVLDTKKDSFMEKMKELEKRINSNDSFSNDEKEVLRKKLSTKYQEIKGKKLSIAEYLHLYFDVISIEDLNLSIRSYNRLKRNGIVSIEDLAGKTEEELLKIRNLGVKLYDEIITKMQSLGIEMEDGHFVNKNLNNAVLDNEIDTNLEKNKELKNVPIDDDQDIQNSAFLEEMSKEELIKHILRQQKIIAEQRKEINELSSKKMEEV